MICPIMSKQLVFSNGDTRMKWINCQSDCMLRIEKRPAVAQETNRTEYGCALANTRAGWVCSAMESD